MFIEVVFSRGAAEERRLKMLVSLDSPRRRVRIDPVYCRFYSQSRNSKRTAARKASCRLAAVRLLSRRTRQGASPSRQTMRGGGGYLDCRRTTRNQHARSLTAPFPMPFRLPSVVGCPSFHNPLAATLFVAAFLSHQRCTKILPHILHNFKQKFSKSNEPLLEDKLKSPLQGVSLQNSIVIYPYGLRLHLYRHAMSNSAIP